MSSFLSCRQVVCLMVILGFMIHHMLRVNVAIALVEMTANNSDTSSTLRFDWDEEQKNDILGCFFWGYLLTEMPGGRLSELFGTRIVLGISMLLAGILTILTPFASFLGYGFVIAVRSSLGLAMGVQWPSIPPMATRWVAPTDTSKFMSHMMASSLGAALTLLVCGYIIAHLGWPSVFYVTGGVTLVWTMLWFYLVYDTPAEHPRISKDVKEKLEAEIGSEVRPLVKQKAPLGKIFTSGPVWAIVLANAFSSFNFYIVLNQLPSYMYQILGFNIKDNGLLSSIPYIVRYSMAVGSCCIADRLRKSKKISTTTVRKAFTTACFWGPTVLFAVQAVWGDSRIVSVVVFTVSSGFNGLGTAGFFSNVLDISPAYSGTIFGLGNCAASVVGYMSTKIVGLITKNKQDFEQWSYIFWILVGVNSTASIIYLIFASGEMQNWNSKEDEARNHKMELVDVSNRQNLFNSASYDKNRSNLEISKSVDN